MSMDGDGSMGGGGAWTSATFDDIPGVTGTAGAEGHGDFDETGVIERRPDVLGIAIGASISALALGVLLLWWFFWWRKYRSEKERRDREAWVRDLVVEVGGEKGKVV